MIVTVTMNAALDRILTVPNFERGYRHRASERMTLAGGKGITFARALKRLGVPVVATGLAGGRNGRRILEELTEEAILNDFVRIEDESRTSTAVVDPTSGTGKYTEIHEWGPAVLPAELELLLEKLDYLSRGAEMVIFAGSLPRAVEDDFYAAAIRDLNRRGVPTALDSEGEPLRLGVEAEPLIVSPNQHEAEALVGQEFFDEEDFRVALDTLSEMGARNVLVTHDRGCFALLRGERGPARYYRALAPSVELVSGVGSGAVLLAGFVAARLESASEQDSLRKAVAAGTASIVEVGAGRFEPEEMGRLMHDVEVSALEPVTAET
jgi:1-phosphofructokinase family hexose kinase